MIPGDTKGVVGCRRFVERIFTLAETKVQNSDGDLKKNLHKAIKKAEEDIEALKFNTAVSSMMEFINAWQSSATGLDKKDFADFLKILSPFTPHLAEELWAGAGFKELCCEQKWPKYDEKLFKEENILLIVQINGKVRDKITANSGITQKEAEKLVLKSEKIKALIGEVEVKKIVYVPNKLINIVI